MMYLFRGCIKIYLTFALSLESTVPFENPVIPRFPGKNVDEGVDKCLIVWRGCGQPSPLPIPNEERERAVYKLYKRKSYLTFEQK